MRGRRGREGKLRLVADDSRNGTVEHEKASKRDVTLCVSVYDSKMIIEEVSRGNDGSAKKGIGKDRRSRRSYGPQLYTIGKARKSEEDVLYGKMNAG